MSTFRKRSLPLLCLAVLALALFTGAVRRRAVRVGSTLALDARRSFAITDQAILDGFSFERVMNTLAANSGVPGASALRLYQQLWDTQNAKPGLVVADAPHCDDFILDGTPSLNGFPRRCPTPEGALAKTNPFVPAEYIPLAIINRFDMTPVDGANCGQYRLIFARTVTKDDRVHLIFEGVLPNPTPSAGLAGCKPVAQFWADLSSVSSMFERRARLETFFFTGLPGFPAMITPQHYSAVSGGGIRSFQITLAANIAPRMYQFRLETRCAAGANCKLQMEPDALENMPAGRFFDARFNTATTRDFREELLRQIPNLAVRDVNRFFMNTPLRYLIGESDSGNSELNIPAIVAFRQSQTTDGGREFKRRIEEELEKAGSSMTADHLILRSELTGCVGCHVASGPIGDGLTFPRSFGSEHVAENFTESGENGSRFSISPAMSDEFIPHRMEILRRFLQSGTPPVRSNGIDPDPTSTGDRTLGGNRTVQ